MAGPDLSPRGVGRLLDDAISLYRANFRKIATMAAVVLFPLALVMGLAQTFYWGGLYDMFASSFSGGRPVSPDMPPAVLVAYSVMGVTSLAYALAQWYFHGTIYKAGGALQQGNAPAPKAMMGDGLRAFPKVVAVGMIIGVVSGIAMVPAVILGIVAVIASPFAGIGVFVAVEVVAVALSVYLEMALPAVAIEDCGPFKALSRSFSLVRNNFWRLALVLVGSLVVSSQVTAALNSPIVIRQIVLGMQDPENLARQIPVGWKVVEGVLQASASVLVLPFSALVVFLCYLDFRARNEGLDLLVRAMELTDEAG